MGARIEPLLDVPACAHLHLQPRLRRAADGANGLSAMARVTGSTAAIAAKLLAKGEIRTKGIVAPEEAFKDKAYEVFMKELNEREITVVERILSPQA